MKMSLTRKALKGMDFDDVTTGPDREPARRGS